MTSQQCPQCLPTGPRITVLDVHWSPFFGYLAHAPNGLVSVEKYPCLLPFPSLRAAQCTHQWKCSHIHTRPTNGALLPPLPPPLPHCLSLSLSPFFSPAPSFSSIDQTDRPTDRPRRRGKRTWIICHGAAPPKPLSAPPPKRNLYFRLKNGETALLSESRSAFQTIPRPRVKDRIK